VITVTILDNFAQGVTRDTFGTMNLYLNGPEDPKLTKAAVKLLNASTDRSKNPHHYIDLKKNADAKVAGNTITYTLKPITDEDPGTYTVAVYVVRGDDLVQQMMKFADLQIKVADVEKPLFTKATCAACHEGPVSGKMYMHHVDVGRSPVGSWSLDYLPEKSCKACHNNDGYAAFADASAPGGRRPDHIVIRAHGVHMGEGLTSDFNTNLTTGNFRNYAGVVFPPDVRNCTTCHTDDRWKTEPSRLACGSCHDNTWFGPTADLPAGMVKHTGGRATTDAVCANCHLPDAGDGSAKSVSEAHAIEPFPFKNAIELTMSTPANGKFYAAGDKPKVTIKVLDKATGTAVNPATIVEPAVSTNVQPAEWRAAEFYVNGPRAHSLPVLTTAAAAKATNVSRASNDLRVRLKASNEDTNVTRFSDAIVYQLGDVADLAPGTYTVYMYVRPGTGIGGTATLNFNVGSTNEESQIAPFKMMVNGKEQGCVTCHGQGRIHTSNRADLMDPDGCRACHDYARQMPGKTAWSQNHFGFGVDPLSRRIHGVHYGRYLARPEENTAGISEIIFPQDVRNCTKCHADPKNSTWNEKPSRLACLACHDSTAAVAHGNLMTWDPTPADPWSGDEQESCEVCHGKDSDSSAAKVHAIGNPYVPPYVREP
jgi:5-methylcytosine-specific restriction endonuclease McrA